MRSDVVRQSVVPGVWGLMALAGLAGDPAEAAEITAIETVALTSDTAPGAGVPYSLFTRAWLNDAGELLFHSTLSGGATGLWWWTGSGEESAVAITGLPAPGFATVPLETIASSSTWAGARGPTFFAYLADVEGVTNDTDDVVYGPNENGALVLVARQGDVAPDTGGQTFGTQLFDFNYGAASDFGLVFVNRTRLAGGGFGDRGLWRQSGTGTTALALETDPAPGVPGAVFSSPDDLALAADGSTVLEGYLEIGVGGVTNANDFGLWGAAGPGPLHLIARQGDRPAGLAEGARYEALLRWELNAAGEVIVSGTYFPPVSGAAEDGLWHHDLYTGATSLLLRKGDVVEVAPGDSRTVLSVSAGIRAAGGGDGKGRAWNDAGQLAATIAFEGGSRGVFRLRVPEPAPATGAGAAAVAALAALRRWLQAIRPPMAGALTRRRRRSASSPSAC